MKVIFLRDLPRQGPKISYWILHASDSIFRHSKVYTVLKFHDFSITQILREINFGDSVIENSAIFTHLEAPNSDFYIVLHFLKTQI